MVFQYVIRLRKHEEGKIAYSSRGDQYSTIFRYQSVLLPRISFTHALLHLYKIHSSYTYVRHTVVSFSPMNFNENPQGERRPPMCRFKRRSRANRSIRPSACCLRSLLIRHSFLTTANKFCLSIFPLTRASQLSQGRGAFTRASPNDSGNRDCLTSARMHLDLAESEANP